MPRETDPSSHCLDPPPGISDVRFAHVAARIPAPLALVDRDLRVRFANPRLCEHVGLPAAELLGVRVDEFVGINFDEDLHRHYEPCFAGRSVTDEGWVAYGERGMRYVRVTLDPMPDVNGLVAYILITIEDLTEHRQAEGAKLRLDRVLRTVADCNCLFAAVDDEMKLFQQVCRIAVDVGGYRMAWIGAVEHGSDRSIRPIANAGDDQHCLDVIRATWGNERDGWGPTGRAVRKKAPVVAAGLSGDPGYQRRGNEVSESSGYRSLAVFPLPDGSDVFGVLSLYAREPDAFDTFEVELWRGLAESLGFWVAARRARAERDRLRQELLFAEKMMATGTLAAGVAHEINTPLAYTIANLDLIVEDFAELASLAPVESGTKLLERIRQAREGSERVRMITRDLLVFSRPDEGVCELTNVREVLEASIRMTWSEIKHRAKLVRSIEEVPAVRGEPSRLGQVFLNLLINAAHAIPEGHERENRITVVARREGPNVVVTVADTGSGIRPEHVPHVFEPFFTTKPVGIGTGLGLPIARDIVETLGGAISFETAPGQGTVFTITLPTAPQTLVVSTAALGPRHEETPVCGRGRLLIVDDDDGVRDVMVEVLSEHDVASAGDGHSALARIRAGERFDLILCDMMMPQMTGVDFHAEVSGLDPAQAERVVFMTGGAYTKRTREFLASVPNERIQKPFDLEVLRRMVARELTVRPRLVGTMCPATSRPTT